MRLLLFISLTLSVLAAQGETTSEYANNNKDSAENPYVRNRCAHGVWGGQGDLPNLNIPQASWMQTPSLMETTTGHYRALGRVIHAENLKDQLVSQYQVNFDAIRADMQLVEQLEILADTFYIQGEVIFYGIREVKIYAREIVADTGSKLSVVTPNWKQEFSGGGATQANGNGDNGQKGNDGLNGPNVEIVCDVITGAFEVSSQGGDGHKGQDGGPGVHRSASQSRKIDKHKSRCTSYGAYNIFRGGDRKAWDKGCTDRSQSGVKGDKGRDGGRGGDAGKPGNGGSAGSITLSYQQLVGQTTLKSCGGAGASPAKNGRGGNGGTGGAGGHGINCFVSSKFVSQMLVPICSGIQTSAVKGDDGADGLPGTPGSKGDDGTVSKALIQYVTLDAAQKKTFPQDLLVLMRRMSLDLLLGDKNNQKGRDALRFIKDVADGRNDAEAIRKDAERKLAFLDVEGIDIFGKNSLFAPLIRWEGFYEDIQQVKRTADDYETAINGIIDGVNNKKNFDQMASKFSGIMANQVATERKRLIEAKKIDNSQKRMYVRAIEKQEERMKGILATVMNLLPDAYEKTKTKLAVDQFIAVLQGIAGFSEAIAGKDPFKAIDTAISIMDRENNKPCLESLGTITKNIKNWLTFGKEYDALEDSSDLNFDKVKVSAIPEVMQANLDISKEKLYSDLVCFLEEAPLPRHVAALKAEMESYFIVAGARIDMIGKVVEIDNNIGGYNFDIPLLEKTEQETNEAGSLPQGGSLSNKLRQTLMGNLLNAYKVLERSFMIKLYELHKALGFRTLWNLNDLVGSFQRIASENALGVGRLNGAVQLSKELQTLSGVVTKARNCFSTLKYITSVRSWLFKKGENKQMFKDLAKGFTRFTISKDNICRTCYNARLIKMYIELYSSKKKSRKQSGKVPDIVHLKVRHLSESYFRAGDNEIKSYLQPITDYRDLKFDRFAISDKTKCRKAKQEGKNSKFCVEKDDNRWKPMCSHPLNGDQNTDVTLGREECRSPSGYYELSIPVDKNLECNDPSMRDINCKDLNLRKFTRMRVWMYYLYWSKYPEGPDDPKCRGVSSKKRSLSSSLLN